MRPTPAIAFINARLPKIETAPLLRLKRSSRGNDFLHDAPQVDSRSFDRNAAGEPHAREVEQVERHPRGASRTGEDADGVSLHCGVRRRRRERLRAERDRGQRRPEVVSQNSEEPFACGAEVTFMRKVERRAVMFFHRFELECEQ